MHDSLERIRRDGFALLPSPFTPAELNALTTALEKSLGRSTAPGESIREPQGAMVAARNLLELAPDCADMWRRPVLVELLSLVLGSDCGLVRVLYFDKPPRHSWSLPWHQDRTIAVLDNRLPSERFSKPTWKAGVAHVQAPDEILKRMLTLRLHLDEVTPKNGPLKVLPGSHRATTQAPAASGAETVLVDRGGVLAIRPLVSHSSVMSDPDTDCRRRVLHLEFAADERLPDGYQWRDFRRVNPR